MLQKDTTIFFIFKYLLYIETITFIILFYHNCYIENKYFCIGHKNLVGAFGVILRLKITKSIFTIGLNPS